jgi:hypothetical protein
MVDAERSWLRFLTAAPGGARRQTDQRVALIATRPGLRRRAMVVR